MGLYHRIYDCNVYILRQQIGEKFWQNIDLTNSTLKVKASIKNPALNPGIVYSEDIHTHDIKED